MTATVANPSPALRPPPRVLVALVTSVVAMLVVVGAAGDRHASSGPGPVAETRVAAHDQLPGPLVDVNQRVLAGQGRGAAVVADEDAVGSRVAPNTARAASGGKDVGLYRHVDDVELADISATGIFRSGPSGTGKYFAETAEDAATWGRWLNPGQGGVVATRVPRSFADDLMRWQKLDGIGPARFVPPELLGRLNDVSNGIRFL